MDVSARDHILHLQQKLFDRLDDCESIDIDDIILSYVSEVTVLAPMRCPEFDKDLTWFNLSNNHDLNDDKITIIDFFTYCCINCLHILPTLKKVEDDFNDDINVVGYHSAKFENEKVESNVQKAIQRYEISHPVVCGDGKLWDLLGIFCWPTIVILSPRRHILFMLVGETAIHKWLWRCTKVALKSCSINHSRNFTRKLDFKPPNNSTRLSFPGKVKSSPDGNFIALSDSGNNRVIILDANFKVKHVIGGPLKGYCDGSFTSSLFDSPQGLAWSSCGMFLYIADTGNDVIRKINFNSFEVDSLTKPIKLSSPWDLVLVDQDKLFVAMSGIHQIWLLALTDFNILKQDWSKGTFKAFAGNSKEENRNNLYPMKAGFAQPSGLSYSPSKNMLFVADSESSSIRKIDLTSGSVKNVIGGSLDPLDLFAFGNCDGTGQNVRLQHPMAVTFSEEKNELFVADTYNHQIKRVDIDERQCTTFVNKETFCEPSGIDYLRNSACLLVCDTNNHRLVKVDPESGESSEINLKFDKSDAETAILQNSHEIIVNTFEVELGKEVILNLKFALKKCLSMTPGVLSSLEIVLPESMSSSSPKEIHFQELQSLPCISLMAVNGSEEEVCQVKIILKLFLCSKAEGTCFKRCLTFIVPVKVTKALKLWNSNQVIQVSHEIE